MPSTTSTSSCAPSAPQHKTVSPKSSSPSELWRTSVSPPKWPLRYLETDRQVAKALATPALGERLGVGIFGVLVDPRAYGALFLMVISLLTGILYFTWAVTGVSMAIGFAVLIIGIPFIILAASLRMFSLMEGRLIEGLLGVRMPRRPPTVPSQKGWLARVMYWLTDARTWSTLLYLILALPLGVLSFSIAITFLSLSLSFFAIPFAQLFLEDAVIQIGSFEWEVQWWLFPFFWLIALLFQVALLHLARGFGHLRAGLARALLVG